MGVCFYFDLCIETLYATSQMREDSSLMTRQYEDLPQSPLELWLEKVYQGEEGNCMERIGDKSNGSRSS